MADYGVLPKLPKDLEMMHHMLHGNIKKKGSGDPRQQVLCTLNVTSLSRGDNDIIIL